MRGRRAINITTRHSRLLAYAFLGCRPLDMGDVLTVPISGDVRLEPGDGANRYPVSIAIHHSSEQAEPGYYAVTLSDYAVRAELTAYRACRLHRYTFPAGKPAMCSSICVRSSMTILARCCGRGSACALMAR